MHLKVSECTLYSMVNVISCTSVLYKDIYTHTCINTYACVYNPSLVSNSALLTSSLLLLLLLLNHFSHVWLFVTQWTVAHQAPLSMGFSRQEYWSGLPCRPPGDFPNPRMQPRSPASQADSLPLRHQGGPPTSPSSPQYLKKHCWYFILYFLSLVT